MAAVKDAVTAASEVEKRRVKLMRFCIAWRVGPGAACWESEAKRLQSLGSLAATSRRPWSLGRGSEPALSAFRHDEGRKEKAASASARTGGASGRSRGHGLHNQFYMGWSGRRLGAAERARVLWLAVCDNYQLKCSISSP